VEPDALRMVMPINLRGEGTALGGNHFTPARFLVPLQIADPEERMRALGELARAARDEPAVALTDALAMVLNQLPTRVTTAFFGAMLKGSDFVTSNVPGSPFPLYVAGAELERLYPFGPLSGTAANVTLLSHCGTCCIGINTDSLAIPDAADFAKSVEAGFSEVLALGAWTLRGHRPRADPAGGRVRVLSTWTARRSAGGCSSACSACVRLGSC